MAAEGVEFRAGVKVGEAVNVDALLDEFDAVVLSGGAEWPRDLDLPPHEFSAIHFAMDYLTQQNKRGAGDDEATAAPDGTISAKGKHVVVIGGGDTGSDCVGTAGRQGAASITSLEIMARPPERENKALAWPDWPYKLRSSSSYDEGCERDWAVTAKRPVGKNGVLEGIECVRVEWARGADGRMQMREIDGSQFVLRADLVLLAMGFLGPRRDGLLEQAGVELDTRGNVKASVADYRTTTPKVFTCGDMRRGQSLVVWAIREGRQCAQAVDAFLMGASNLPR
jgi:glutamate synthase (NADPH/NADH) small chain